MASPLIDGTVELTEASPAQRATFRSEGWLHAAGLVSAERCAELRRLLQPHMPDPTTPELYFIDAQIWYAEPRLRELWIDSDVERFVHSLLEVTADELNLTAGGIHALGPHTQEPTYWHQETAVSGDPNGPYLLAAWVALTDVPANRAPLLVVPRSHHDPHPTFGRGVRYGHDRFDNPRFVDDDETAFPNAVPIVARAGDAVFFDGWTLHSSRPNNDSEPRIALTGRYRLRSGNGER